MPVNINLPIPKLEKNPPKGSALETVLNSAMNQGVKEQVKKKDLLKPVKPGDWQGEATRQKNTAQMDRGESLTQKALKDPLSLESLVRDYRAQHPKATRGEIEKYKYTKQREVKILAEKTARAEEAAQKARDAADREAAQRHYTGDTGNDLMSSAPVERGQELLAQDSQAAANAAAELVANALYRISPLGQVAEGLKKTPAKPVGEFTSGVAKGGIGLVNPVGMVAMGAGAVNDPTGSLEGLKKGFTDLVDPNATWEERGASLAMWIGTLAGGKAALAKGKGWAKGISREIGAKLGKDPIVIEKVINALEDTKPIAAPEGSALASLSDIEAKAKASASRQPAGATPVTKFIKEGSKPAPVAPEPAPEPAPVPKPAVETPKAEAPKPTTAPKASTKPTTAIEAGNARTPDVIRAEIEATKARMDARNAPRRGGTKSGAKQQIGKEDYADALHLGKLHVELGLKTFADWSKAMVDTIGEHIRPHLDKIWASTGGKSKKVLTQPISASHASSDVVRSYIELPERKGATPETRTQWVDEAKAEGMPARSAGIAEDINGGKRKTLDKTEEAGMAVRLQELRNEYDSLKGRTDEAAMTRRSAAETETEAILDALDTAGTEWGRSGVARQIAIKKDYSPAMVKHRLSKAAKQGGKPATPEELAAIERQADELAAKESQSKTKQAAFEAADSYAKKRTVDQKLRDYAVRVAPSAKEYAAALKQIQASLAQSAVMIGGGGAGVPMDALRVVVRHHVAQGVTKVADLAAAVSAATGRKVSAAQVREALGQESKVAAETFSQAKADAAAQAAMERRSKALDDRIAELKADLESGNTARKPAPEPKGTTPAIEAKRGEVAALNAQKAAQRRIAEIKADKARLDEQIRTKSYANYWSKAREQLSREHYDLRADVLARRKFIERQIELAKHSKANIIARTDATISALSVANVVNRLTDLTVGNFGSLTEQVWGSRTAANIERALFKGVRAGTDTPGVTGIGRSELSFALKGYLPRIWQEMKDLMRQGSVEHQIKYGTRAEAFGPLKYAQRFAGLTDIPTYDLAFRSAFKAISERMPKLDELVREKIAENFAQETVYMNDTALSSMIDKAFTSDKTGGQSVVKGSINLMARFPRILAAVEGRITDMYFGGAKAGTQWVIKRVTREEWTPAERRLLTMRLVRNGKGVALATAGYIAAKNGWIKVPEDKYGSPNWNRWLQNCPGAVQAFLLGATIHKYLNGKQGSAGVGKALVESITNHPYFGGVNTIDNIVDGFQRSKDWKGIGKTAGWEGAKIGYRAVVPSQLREIGRGDWFGEWLDARLKKGMARDLIRGKKPKGKGLGISLSGGLGKSF